MALKLTEDQKADLRGMLENKLMTLAMEEALRETWRRKGGAETLEAAAMAYNHLAGASGVLDELFSMAESKEKISITPRKLRHT
jgi:hypothetical protein